MQATVADLHHRTNEFFTALEQGKRIMLIDHGKPRGTILPYRQSDILNVAEHPFFGMYSDQEETVDELMSELRGNRHDI